MSIPVYRMPSDSKFAIIRMAPGLLVSSKATLASKEIVDSATARRSAAKKATNYILNDRKNKKQFRAQPENVGTRSKYVLFQQKGRALFYTEVDLFKADLESARSGADADNGIEDAEQAEMNRQKQMLARLRRHSKLSSFLSKGEADDEDIEPAARIFGRQKTVRKTQHELGLGDDQRDLDFEEEFDDDDAVDKNVTIDTVGDGRGPDVDQDHDLTQAGKKIAQILSKNEDLDEFSESEEEDDLGGEDNMEDEVPPEPVNRKRTGDATMADSEAGIKRPRLEPSTAPAVASSSASSTAPPQEVFVTDEEVREQFRKHGRLTVKSLARIMEDTWKYKGDQARKELFAIVQRICTYQADPNRPNVKYLVLKP